MPADQPEEQTVNGSARHAGPNGSVHRAGLPRRIRRSFEPLIDEQTLYGDPRDLNEQELNRLSKETLLTIARSESLPNRSKMNKAQLARTLRKHLRKAR